MTSGLSTVLLRAYSAAKSLASQCLLPAPVIVRAIVPSASACHRARPPDSSCTRIAATASVPVAITCVNGSASPDPFCQLPRFPGASPCRRAPRCLRRGAMPSSARRSRTSSRGSSRSSAPPGEQYLCVVRRIDTAAIRDVLERADAIGWHPAVFLNERGHPLDRQLLGCIVGVMTDPVTALRTDAISRTYLDAEGRKLGKAKTLGSPAGIVRLSEDAEVLSGLHLAEGLESGMTAMARGFRPLWVTGGKGLLQTFPLRRASSGSPSSRTTTKTATAWRPRARSKGGGFPQSARPASSSGTGLATLTTRSSEGGEMSPEEELIRLGMGVLPPPPVRLTSRRVSPTSSSRCASPTATPIACASSASGAGGCRGGRMLALRHHPRRLRPCARPLPRRSGEMQQGPREEDDCERQDRRRRHHDRARRPQAVRVQTDMRRQFEKGEGVSEAESCESTTSGDPHAGLWPARTCYPKRRSAMAASDGRWARQRSRGACGR